MVVAESCFSVCPVLSGGGDAGALSSRYIHLTGRLLVTT